MCSLFSSWAFLALQVKEFRNLGFYVSDSVYGCVFFFLSGLHFFHVVVGLVLISIPGTNRRVSTFLVAPSALSCLGIDLQASFSTSTDVLVICQAVYWHFVEGVWLFVYLVLYSYFQASMARSSD